MSPKARIVIAVFALLFAAMMAVSAIGSERPIVSYIFSAFCVAVAIACLPGRAGRIALRVVAAIISFAYVVYFVSELLSGRFVSGPTNALKAFLGLLIFGVPFGYIAITGKFGPWQEALDSEKTDVDRSDD